jgi:hypothetical protein
MRRILLSVMLVFILAGGVITFISSSNVAQAHSDHHCEADGLEDLFGESGPAC